LYGCLIPLWYRPIPFDEALAAFGQISYFDPLLLRARGDWVFSAVQFTVLSFLYMAAVCVDRRRAFGFVAAGIVVSGCIVLSIALEFLQIYFPPRTVSMNDIVVESLGGAAGALVWLVCGQRLTDWVRRLWSARGLSSLVTQCLPAYIALVLIVQLMPFDPTLSVNELAQKYREGKIGLLPFRELTSGGIAPFFKVVTNAACFAPLGVLLSLAPKWSSWRWPIVLRIGLCFTIAIESLQLFVYSRHSSATDIVTGTAAILLGWWLARTLRDRWVLDQARVSRLYPAGRNARGSLAWMLLFFGWLISVFLVSWEPFEFTTDPARFATADGLLTDEDTGVYGWRRMAWAPLADYYWESKYDAVDQFLRKSLSFAPLGVIMALSLRKGNRSGGSLLVVFLALAAGLGIEAGQYFIPSRHPSTTDLLVESFGAWLGFAVARHVWAALSAEGTPAGSAYEFCG
jgi:glycopeptide antibiotics resistance protein